VLCLILDRGELRGKSVALIGKGGNSCSVSGFWVDLVGGGFLRGGFGKLFGGCCGEIGRRVCLLVAG